MNTCHVTRVGVLLSGTGRTLENLAARAARGALPIVIPLVIADRKNAYGLVRAEEHGLATKVIRPREHHSETAFSEVIAGALRHAAVDLVIMAGWLRLWRIPPDFAGRVMNIHPALLPAFGGAGFYGRNVHRAVREAGVKVTGCTVHFADNEYDHGPIILQKTVGVDDDDDMEAIADKVFALECEAYPEAIDLYCRGRLRVEGRRVRVLAPGEIGPERP